MNPMNYESIQLLLSGFLKKQEKSFCFITAASGTGKTTLLRRYCHMHENAFYMKLPLAILKSRKSVILAILESLEISHIKRYKSELQLIELLNVVLRKKQVSLLVIDDIQEVKHTGQSLELFEMLRVLSEQTQVKFVFSGTDMPDLSASTARRSEIQKAV